MRKLLIDSMISITIGVALLFIIELGLRILYPERVLDIAYDRQRLEKIAYKFDPEALIALKPNISKSFRKSEVNGGEEVRWKTNAASFRGGKLRNDPELRVIVYGDSNVQARFSRLPYTFPMTLQKRLKALTGKDVEVINAGIVGAGPDQALIRFSQDVHTYKPDVVVFHIFADNDFGDIVRNRLLELNEGGELVSTAHETEPDDNLKGRHPRLLVTRAAQSALKRFAGVDLNPVIEEPNSVEERLKAYQELTAQEFAIYKEGKARAFSHFSDRYDIDIALHPESESATTKVALMEGVLKKARRIADENNVEMVVLIQPSSLDLTTNLNMNYETFQQFPDYRPDRLTSILDDICDRLGIHRINLYPVFRDNNPQSLFFMKDDDHWNDEGQQLAGQVTARYIYKKVLGKATLN